MQLNLLFIEGFPQSGTSCKRVELEIRRDFFHSLKLHTIAPPLEGMR